MNKLLRTLPALLGVMILIGMSIPDLRACAMCMGGADEKLIPALNASIGLLLSLTMLALGSFFFFIIYLARRDGLPMEADDIKQA